MVLKMEKNKKIQIYCLFAASLFLGIFGAVCLYLGISSGEYNDAMGYFSTDSIFAPVTYICMIAGPLFDVVAWVLFGIVWGCAVLATTFTAIDLNKYKVFSMICYIAMGWCIIFALKTTIQAIGIEGFVYLITGGISYTIGAVLYRIGKKRRYIHSVFHIFVVIGSILHFFCIFLYTM